MNSPGHTCGHQPVIQGLRLLDERRAEKFLTRLSHLRDDLARELLIDAVGQTPGFTAQARETIDVLDNALTASVNANRFDRSGFVPGVLDLRSRIPCGRRCTST